MTSRGLGHPYFSLPPPWLVAHRGGSLEAPENTLVAFDHAAALGVDAIETDVRLSRDGEVVVFHDPDTLRITGVPGAVEERTLAELQALDAAYNFTTDGGQTFPWRGKGVRIPTLTATFARFPSMRFNVEAKGKGPALATRLAQVIAAARREDSVCVGAERFWQSRRLAKLLPRNARFLSAAAALVHYLAARGFLPGFLAPGGYDLAALPTRQWGLRVASEPLIAHFRDRGMAVQFWTVDREEEMRQLLAWKADGIMSDRPTLLKAVLGR